MELNLKALEDCFNRAVDFGAKYIAVKVKMEGLEGTEVIINPRDNFGEKLLYYKIAYNEDLTLKSFNGIKIVDFAYGNSYEQIECSFFGMDEDLYEID